MSRAALAAECRRLLGAVAGPVLVIARRPRAFASALAAPEVSAVVAPTPRRGDWSLPPGTRPCGAAVVSFLGRAARPHERQTLLAGLRGLLPPGAPLVLLDHNRPRRWPRRALAALGLLAAGLPPRRARYPAARELQALGFPVVRLRLAAGERVQLVLALRPALPAQGLA